MSETREVVFLSGVRTAIGKYGGSLKDFTPSDLGALVSKEAIQQAGIEAGEIQHAVFGNVIHTDVTDHYVARVAAVKAGVPETAPAFTLNRLCGSGLQAVISAAQMIMLGGYRYCPGWWCGSHEPLRLLVAELALGAAHE